MELGSPLPKTQKLLNDSVDLISRLPDHILCHIFSFLPTKEVVKTSSLSKRWEPLWTLAPNVDFSDQFASNAAEFKAKFGLFKDYVDSVLFHHGGINIKNCFLECATVYSPPHIYAWVSAVLSCNVEELTIKSTSFDIKELPLNLFSCKTLLSLKIDKGFVVNLPYHVCFPSLKKLHLDSVIYAGDSSMQRLFSSCLVLEELYFRRGRGDCVVIASIMIPSLKRLYLAVPSVALIGIAGHEYKIYINAPCLEYLETSDYGSIGHYSVDFSPSLVEAHILGTCRLLVEKISNVRLLTLSGIAMQNLKYRPSNQLPIFHNLLHLELGVNHLVGWDLLSDLLINSPNLEALVFMQGLVEPQSGDGFHGFYWIPPDTVPECLLLHLKTIRIRHFAGKPCEIFLVRYMLEHAEVLEELRIQWFDFDLDKETVDHMSSVEDEILSIESCSIDCQIEFI